MCADEALQLNEGDFETPMKRVCHHGQTATYMQV